ncbi:hypothetical protein, partial [Streptomyces sp. NPDC047981]|uniref:hypothetical protein n=1 Tax=Streptomyces sp. NPDC047981 TaxID=3154610 RepID=UPI00342BDB95
GPAAVHLTPGDVELLGLIYTGSRHIASITATTGSTPSQVKNALAHLGKRVGMTDTGYEAVLATLVDDLQHGMRGVWANVDPARLPRPEVIRQNTLHHKKERQGQLSPADREVLGAINTGSHTIDAIAQALGISKRRAEFRLINLGKRVGMTATGYEAVLADLVGDLPGRQGVWAGVDLRLLPRPEVARQAARQNQMTPGDLEILGAINAGHRDINAIALALNLTVRQTQTRLADLGQRVGMTDTSSEAVLAKLLNDLPGMQGAWQGIVLADLPTPEESRENITARVHKSQSRLSPGDLEVLGAIHAGHHNIVDIAKALNLPSVRHAQTRLTDLGKRVEMTDTSSAAVLTKLLNDLPDMQGAWQGILLADLPTPGESRETRKRRKQ